MQSLTLTNVAPARCAAIKPLINLASFFFGVSATSLLGIPDKRRSRKARKFATILPELGAGFFSQIATFSDFGTTAVKDNSFFVLVCCSRVRRWMHFFNVIMSERDSELPRGNRFCRGSLQRLVSRRSVLLRGFEIRAYAVLRRIGFRT